MIFDPHLLILFLAGIPIGIWAVLFGASMFLQLPLFQLLFPQMGLAFLVANMKVGSLLRNLVAVFSARQKLDLAPIIRVIIPLSIGSVAGSFGILSLSQVFVLPVLLLAIGAIEFSEWLQKHVTNHVFILAALLVGFYMGVLGAGISILIWALLKCKFPQDNDLVKLRTDGLFIEGIITLISVVIFFFYGRVDIQIALVWAAGSMVGGYLGGRIIKVTGKWSQKTQTCLLRTSFAVAMGVALIKLL